LHEIHKQRWKQDSRCFGSNRDSNRVRTMSEEEIKQYENTLKKEIKEISKGYVYLIKGENERYKIGFSKNAERRTKELCLSSCEKHILIHSFYCENPYQKEQNLHKKYASKRTHSEWFELEETDVNFIKGLSDEI